MTQWPPQDPNNQKGSILDIDKLGTDKNYDVNINIQSTKGVLDRIESLVPLVIASVIALMVTGGSLYVLINAEASIEDKKTAQSLLTLVIGLTVGYISGKTQSRQN